MTEGELVGQGRKPSSSEPESELGRVMRRLVRKAAGGRRVSAQGTMSGTLKRTCLRGLDGT